MTGQKRGRMKTNDVEWRLSTGKQSEGATIKKKGGGSSVNEDDDAHRSASRIQGGTQSQTDDIVITSQRPTISSCRPTMTHDLKRGIPARIHASDMPPHNPRPQRHICVQSIASYRHRGSFGSFNREWLWLKKSKRVREDRQENGMGDEGAKA